MKVAGRIVELSDQVLSMNVNGNYIALKTGTGPNSNAVTVTKYEDRVSFFIRSTALLDRAKTEGFDPEIAKQTSPSKAHRYRFWGLSYFDLQEHEGLFREIVKESVSTIIDRRPKKH
ncbi:MAG TPA: hypothetical protein VGG42_07575 [Acidobacteriaceae bacterium]